MGPLLFLVYDVLSRVDSKVRLFVDDSMLRRIINNDEDVKKLQSDLDSLQQWDDDWQMALNFNLDKCEVLRVTSKRHFIPATYSIHRQKL